LADYVTVNGAGLENGLLKVDLVRELPEAMKSRSIPITTNGVETNSEKSKVIDNKAA
jgi:molecular chaperone IbpA